MLTYPVSLHPKPYGGADPKKREKYFRELEQHNRVAAYINEQIETKHSGEYLIEFDNYEIAREVGMSKEDVHRISMRADGSSNGLTVCNPKNKPKETGDAGGKRQ